ncbi:ABC transporter substrate-binding protein [Pseudonocardia nematodicida]|uniref:ABC transporter substrate-binding protein n=1 Tax=Pseudonocardia nematodicida TaxID=1206997 RepID=A0ABV1K5W2_9PSEU
MSRVLTALTLGAVLLLSGCGAPGQSGAADGVTPMGIAVSNRTLFSTGLPYYVAQEKGFFSDAGLDVSVTFTGGGAETVQAVVSGSSDIGVETSAPAAVGAFVEGAPIRIVAASTTGLDLVWFAKPDSGITDQRGLAGKSVGYSATGGSSHIGILEINDLNTAQGLPPVDAQVIGGPADQFTAVETGQIDAGWTQPPFFLAEIEDGTLVEVADGADLDRYRDVAVRVNIANDRFLTEHPDAARAYFQAVDRSFDWIFDNPDEAVDIWQRSTDLDIERETLLTTFDYLQRENFRTAPLNGQDVILEDALKFDFITEELTPEQEQQLFDSSYQTEGAS